MITAGTINTGFVIGDGFTDMVYTFKTQPDGKILVGGNFEGYDNVTAYYITRLNQDGSLDNLFTNGSFLNDYVKAIDISSTGKIYVGGLFTDYNGSQTNRFVVLNSNGTLSQQFPDGFNDYVRAIKVQDDGKILIGGNFTTYNSNSYNRLIRINPNGTVDESFNIGSGFDGNVYSIQIESDGSILVGGEFGNCNGISSNRIIRLDSSGTITNTFGSGFDSRVQVITLQPDNKILLGGQFSSFNGNSSNYMVRINQDGSFDTSFNLNDWVNDIFVQNDGKIVVVGRFNDYDGTSVNEIVRLNPSGTIDGSFYQGQGFSNYPNIVVELLDSNLLIGGWFTQYDNTNVNYIVSLYSNELTEGYPYVYEANFCVTNPSFTFYNQETIYVGSFVELTQNEVITVSNLQKPGQLQCATIISQTNVAATANFEYTNSFGSCDECMSGISISALISYCSDPNDSFPVVVDKNYKIGDIFTIEGPFYVDFGSGTQGVYLNDCFQIVDVAPWDNNYAPLPKMVDYAPQINCEVCRSSMGIYYGWGDCSEIAETGYIKSNQLFDLNESFYLNVGSSPCKSILYTTTVIEEDETTFNDIIENAYQVVSTKKFVDCADCQISVSTIPTWLENFNGDGNIIFNTPIDVDIIGSDDDDEDGWSYIYVKVPNSGTMSFNWAYTTTDEPSYDWGFYYVSQDEPNGDINVDFEQNKIGEQDGDTGSVTIDYVVGDWITIGVYATDSSAGPGILSVLFTQINTNAYSSLNFTGCNNESGEVLLPISFVEQYQGAIPIDYSPISTTGLDLIEDGSFDDEYFVVDFPAGFEINFLTSGYTSVNVSSNPFITFGDPNSGQPDNCCFDIPNEIPTDVELPGVFLSFSCPNEISNYDAEMYQLYTGLTDSGNTFVIKYIGSDHCDEIATLVYGFKFYKNNNNYFDLIIEENTSFFNNDPTGGVSNAIDTNWVVSFNSSPSRAYRIGGSFPNIKANFGNTPSICGTIGGEGEQVYYYSDGTSTYDDCDNCDTQYYTILRNVSTGEIKYVTMSPQNIERSQNIT